MLDIINKKRKAIEDCKQQYKIQDNPNIDDDFLNFSGTPTKLSKALAILIMLYKKEVKKEELVKISTQPAGLIRDLRDKGFIFKDNGNQRNPRYEFINEENQVCRMILGFKQKDKKQKKIKGLAKELLEKSVACAISSLEIYNKPDFKYREETYAILMINAWELLLKAKILDENNNKIKELYIIAPSSKKPKPSRSGNPITIGLDKSLSKIQSTKNKMDQKCVENIEALIVIRDNSIHFVNNVSDVEQEIYKIGTASLKNYIELIQMWFDYDLTKYNFYLMPLSFLKADNMDTVIINNKRTKETNNLLKYLSDLEDKHPSNENSRFNVTLNIETKYVKSKKGINYKLSNDPDAKKIHLSEEEIIKQFPLSYTDLIKKCRNIYLDFKVTQDFHKERYRLESDQRYCFPRPYDIKKPKGNKRNYYSHAIFNEFDNKYIKKKNQNRT